MADDRADQDAGRSAAPRANQKSRVSQSKRAGVEFPVGRIRRQLRKRYASRMRIGAPAAVLTAAVLEYLNAEILELAGYVARDFKVKCITPRHLQIAIRRDAELDSLVSATIAGGGVVPHIHKALIGDKDEKVKDPQPPGGSTQSQTH
ncbi:histone H2A.V-like [Drosophila biarmipes]|uniref:histone H2A.V-like n=1 Tax=Drosophila biarmipes TaxID=125945 RepID=UPI0007E69E8C|nr:histone H2A.V-like [Drosophila biarmipes]